VTEAYKALKRVKRDTLKRVKGLLNKYGMSESHILTSIAKKRY